MTTLFSSVLLLSFLCYTQVPSSNAASLSTLTMFPDITDLCDRSKWTRQLHLSERRSNEAMADDDDDQLLSADKRGRGVDAWSICPPHMTDVDCFYAYLRVYARLRKAAEASDRVSMRNIGKRGQSAMTSTSLSESDRAHTKLKLVKLCPDGMSPAGCFQLTKRVYQQVLSNLQDAALKTAM